MKKLILILALTLTANMTIAQVIPKSMPLEISGSGDLYYKYDFSKNENIKTSFATDHNSISLGMLDLALKKSTGKASFVGELSFGPRGQVQSIPNADGTYDDTNSNSFHIQNLYVTYAFTDNFSMTAGYMGTFIGYELISPTANFQYSTSYLFTNGPFQNAGIKANYKFTDKFSGMIGVFNDSWNTYTSEFGVNAIGAQLSYVIDGASLFLNFMDGKNSGTIFDITASFQVSKKFKLGLNAADFSNTGDAGYSGVALYPSLSLTESFGLGLRGEYFKYKEGSGDTDVTALTLSGNYKLAGFTIIPEFRIDSNSDEVLFINSEMTPTKSASQFLIAVVYGF